MNEVTYGLVGVVLGLLGGVFILKALTSKQNLIYELFIINKFYDILKIKLNE